MIFDKVLRNLMLTDNQYFLRIAAPGVREEELEFFEEMIGEEELPEDKIMDQLSDLTKDVKHIFDLEEDFSDYAKIGRKTKIKA